MCLPLFDQLKAEVETALRPFYVDPLGKAGQIMSGMDVQTALLHFVGRGSYLSRNVSAAEVGQFLLIRLTTPTQPTTRPMNPSSRTSASADTLMLAIPDGIDYGLDRYNQKYLQAALVLPPDLAARLRYPILNWREFVAVAREIHRLIDARTEHELEGWERCGFIVHEYRLSLDGQQWINAEAGLQAMDARQRAEFHARIEATPGLWRTRKLSPQEVWEAGRQELVTVPDHALLMLLNTDDARHGERCEANRLFILKDRTVAAEPLHFDASVLIRQGGVRTGERYSVFLNPFDAESLIVCDGALRYLGTAPLWDRVARLDRGEANRRLAYIREDQSACLNNLARRGAGQTRRMLAMQENNAALLTGRSSATDRRAAAILQAAEDAAMLDADTFALPASPAPPLALPFAAEPSSDLDLL